MGMAKSGDDLMRWQSIARGGGGAATRKHTLSINRTCWVSQRAVRLVNGERRPTDFQWTVI